MTTKAFDKICVDNVDETVLKHMRVPEDRRTIFFKCYREQAMDRKHYWVLDMYEIMQSNCFSKHYGLSVDIRASAMKEVFLKEVGEGAWHQNFKNFYEGLLDHVEWYADTYLDGICNSDSEMYEKLCALTPVTESLLSFKSKFVESLNQDVNYCCKEKNKSLEGNEKEILKKCLKKIDIYGQFLGYGSQFMRDLYRINTKKTWLCSSQTLYKTEGILQKGYDDLTNEEKYFYGTDGLGKDLWKMKELNAPMRPENFFFFLRGFKNVFFNESDYYTTACDACSLGEKLGLKAYVYPALMCPALVSEALYEPVRLDPVCPDLLFYKFQVAHYCCLDSALETYNLGSNYNPEECIGKDNLSQE